MEILQNFKVLEQPRSNLKCSSFEDFSFSVDVDYNCVHTFKEGGFLGHDICNGGYGSGNCGGQDNYCGKYSTCSMHLG